MIGELKFESAKLGTDRRKKRKQHQDPHFRENSFPNCSCTPLIAQMVEHETVDLVVACSSHARRNLFILRSSVCLVGNFVRCLPVDSI